MANGFNTGFIVFYSRYSYESGLACIPDYILHFSKTKLKLFYMTGLQNPDDKAGVKIVNFFIKLLQETKNAKSNLVPLVPSAQYFIFAI